MNARSRAARSGHIAGARTLSHAVPFSFAAAAGVAIPGEAAGPRKVAIPREGAISDVWAIPRKSVGHSTHGTKAGKLKLSESNAGGRKSWTIPTGGQARTGGEALRVRRSDAGFAVSLRFRDQSDALREPYLCYLTADEWGAAKQGSLEQLVMRISEKMRHRREAPGLVELISRLEAAAMTKGGKEKER